MKKIEISLNSNSLEDAVKELMDYKADLIKKTNNFCEKLADIGIEVAVTQADKDSHKFSEMVEFIKEWDGGYLYVIGRNSNLSGLHLEWWDGEGTYHTETISPILALEYGTAGLAIKGHKGSFAVTGNHINDEKWYYYDSPTLSSRHVASAEEPHEMMYHAAIEMKKQIKAVAKEVWGD